MSQPSSFWVRHAALVFALGTFAAAMLAFSIALWLDMPRRYWAMTSVYITFDPAQFAELYALMSAQRNTRLLGTFARLNRRDGKPQYLRHQPRIWTYPHAFAGTSRAVAREWYLANVPPPVAQGVNP